MKKRGGNTDYQLRVSRAFQEEPSLSLFGGLSDLREKSLWQIREEKERACRAGYEKILLPWNSPAHREWEGIKYLIKEDPSVWRMQIHSGHLEFFQEKAGILPLEFDILTEDFSSELEFFIKGLKQDFQITLPAHKGLDLYQLKKRIPDTLHLKTYVHFPCFHKSHPRLYSNKDMYRFLKEKWFPPPPMDVFNLSIPADLKLEPEISPDFGFQTNPRNPEISVIIPAYNSRKELAGALIHLFRQTLPMENFEVIVVDDGGLDGTGEFLKREAFLRKMNFKYIFFHREKRRRRADHRFRAGLARNVGVKQAEGPVLAFLDSDVLVGPDYLRLILKELARHAVLQHPRLHLKRKAPWDIRRIEKSKHTFVKGDGYWEKFYIEGKEWNRKPLPWRYISTNTLCLKADLFKRAGRFRKNHTCYGFEDTDLGYRLYQLGESFKLSSRPAYHIFRRSEFFHFNFIKRLLLKPAVNIFFHNTHSLEGYEEFSHLISEI